MLYTLSIVAARGLSILIFPILVNQMNETELVNYDWMLTNIMISVTFSVFGIDSAAGRIIANKNVNRTELRDTSFSIILIQTCFTVIILFYYINISHVTFKKVDLVILFLLLISSIVINQTTNTAKWLLQRDKVIKIQLSLGILQAAFLYFTFLLGNMNFTTALGSQMAGAICSAFYGLYLNNGGIPKFQFSKKLKLLWAKSAILGLNTVVAGLYQAVEKNIIYQTASSNEASSYLVHLKVVLLFSFALSALQISLAPHLIKILDAKQNIKFFRYNFIILNFVILCALLFTYITPVVFDFFSDKHIYDHNITKLLLLIQIFIIINSLCETIFIFLEKYKFILFLNSLHLFVFLLACLYAVNKNVVTIIIVSLISLALKFVLMAIFNIYYFLDSCSQLASSYRCGRIQCNLENITSFSGLSVCFNGITC